MILPAALPLLGQIKIPSRKRWNDCIPGASVSALATRPAKDLPLIGVLVSQTRVSQNSHD